MQSFLPAFEAAGVSVFVVFAESAEQLKTFSDDFDIQIPLLADPNSEIIRRLGILNTTLTQDDAPFYGIPYPGSYIIGADGIVTAKFFEQNSLIRAHPELLLRAATGRATNADSAPSLPSVEPEVVELEVSIEADELRAFLLRDLVVTLRVPKGQHLYGPPVSEGLVVTSVTIDDNNHIGAQAPVFPPTTPMVLKGTGEELHVFDGDVTVRVPLLYNGFPPRPNEDGRRTVELTGSVRWQACDDHSCHIPRTDTFTLTVPVRSANVPRSVR